VKEKGVIKNAKLTPEQQDLAGSNYKLVWKLFKKWRKCCKLTNDELYDCCIDSLIYTAKIFNKNKGFKFSTLMFNYTANKIIINALRDREAVKRKVNLKTSSLDVKVNSKTDKEEKGTTFVNNIKCYDDYNLFINKELAAQAIAVLNEEEKEIVIEYFYNGLSQRGIADKIGKGQSHVSRHYRKAIEKMQQSMQDKILI
jgi:RNA polymerase sigma factor (sigma-70 family)